MDRIGPCDSCPPGSQGSDGTCSACTPGKYSNPERTSCLPCDAGNYASKSNSSDATCEGPCSAGYYCNAGSTSPTQHACGRAEVYCPQGSDRPLVCDAGSYTANTDNKIGNSGTRTVCLMCDEGHACSNGIRKECEDGDLNTDTGLKECTIKTVTGPWADAAEALGLSVPILPLSLSFS